MFGTPERPRLCVFRSNQHIAGQLIDDSQGRTLVGVSSLSPTLRKSIGLAYLPIERTEPGCDFTVKIRGREEPAVVVPTPFYERPKKRG